jgi:hypothetical protein
MLFVSKFLHSQRFRAQKVFPPIAFTSTNILPSTCPTSCAATECACSTVSELNNIFRFALDDSYWHEALRKTRPLSVFRWGASNALCTMLMGNRRASRVRLDVLPVPNEHRDVTSSSAYAVYRFQDPNDWCGRRCSSNRDAVY